MKGLVEIIESRLRFEIRPEQRHELFAVHLPEAVPQGLQRKQFDESFSFPPSPAGVFNRDIIHQHSKPTEQVNRDHHGRHRRILVSHRSLAARLEGLP
jgi:hypothetical protein